MNTFWEIIILVFLGIMFYGIQKTGELDYLNEKKIRDYSLNDILTVLIVIGMIILFGKILLSFF